MVDIAHPKLDDDQLQIIASVGKLKSYKDGEVLVAAGAVAPNFYAILSGEVNVVDFSSGSPKTIGTRTAREFTGNVSLLSGRASNVSMVAQGNVEAYEILPEQLRRIMDEKPSLGNLILTEFVARWQLAQEHHLTPVQVIGSRFSSDTFRIRDFLSKNRILFTWIDIEIDSNVEALLEHFQISEQDTPVVACGSDWVLRNPTNRELAERLGILRAPSKQIYDLAIIGGGPSGLAAAVYGASEGLKTLVLERTAPGGQAGSSSRIENYPGFPIGLSGDELAARMVLQAQRFGAEISSPSKVMGLDFENGYPVLQIDGGELVSAKCLLIASGASYRRLDVEGRAQFEGVGVYYAATPVEAQMCAGSQVIIVGGANSAGQAAVFLAENARKVCLLLRGDDLAKNMSRYLAKRIEQTANIELLTNCEISRMSGDGHLQSVEITHNRTGEKRTVETPAVFTFIGAVPHTDRLPAEIERDDKGFIKTGPAVATSPHWSRPRRPFYLETSRPGVFAAGDVRLGSMKRVASAVGEGAMAVAFVHEYLKTL